MVFILKKESFLISEYSVTSLHTSYVFFNKLEILNVVLFLLQCYFLKVHFCSPIIVFVQTIEFFHVIGVFFSPTFSYPYRKLFA